MPPKAYLEFDDPESGAEFEFFLAEKLHRTVAELDEMSNEEYMRWNVYYGRKAQIRELAAKQLGKG